MVSKKIRDKVSTDLVFNFFCTMFEIGDISIEYGFESRISWAKAAKDAKEITDVEYYNFVILNNQMEQINKWHSKDADISIDSYNRAKYFVNRIRESAVRGKEEITKKSFVYDEISIEHAFSVPNDLLAEGFLINMFYIVDIVTRIKGYDSVNDWFKINEDAYKDMEYYKAFGFANMAFGNACLHKKGRKVVRLKGSDKVTSLSNFYKQFVCCAPNKNNGNHTIANIDEYSREDVLEKYTNTVACEEETLNKFIGIIKGIDKTATSKGFSNSLLWAKVAYKYHEISNEDCLSFVDLYGLYEELTINSNKYLYIDDIVFDEVLHFVNCIKETKLDFDKTDDYKTGEDFYNHMYEEIMSLIEKNNNNIIFFKKNIDKINELAKDHGFDNEKTWAKAALSANEINEEEYEKFCNLSNKRLYVIADESTLCFSDEQIEDTRKFLKCIELTNVFDKHSSSSHYA